MSYSKQEILESFVKFKVENGHYPSRKDLGKEDGLPGKSTIYRIFGSLDNAIKQAELFEHGEITEEEDPKELKRIKEAIGKKKQFQCRLCGSLINYSDQYHSDLARFLIRRFIELLEKSDNQEYSKGVLDAIHSVFGPNNLQIRLELQRANHYKEFEERFGKGELESAYKLRCYFCKELKDEWEVTVDTSTKPFAEYICEDCLTKKLAKDNKSNEGEYYAKA